MSKTELSPVYGSTEPSVMALHTNDEYGGAHTYAFRACDGWHNGETKYTAYIYKIDFVRKRKDSEGNEHIEPGLQSEQLVQCLIDRHEKLNKVFPSAQHEKMIQGLQMFLDACKERIDDRVQRGVMGDLELNGESELTEEVQAIVDMIDAEIRKYELQLAGKSAAMRSGSTTRLIDKAVQDYFENGWAILRDDVVIPGAQTRMLMIFLYRLDREHHTKPYKVLAIYDRKEYIYGHYVSVDDRKLPDSINTLYTYRRTT